MSQKWWEWNEALSILMLLKRDRLGVGQHKQGGASTRQFCSEKLAGEKRPPIALSSIVRGTQYVTIDPAGQAWYDDDMSRIARVVAPCAG